MTEYDAGPASYLRLLARARERSVQQEWTAAVPLWEAVIERNPVDGGLWLDLADARRQAGRHPAAVGAYQHALELGTGRWTAFPFHIAYAIACCYAADGDNGPALDWLERAFELGYRELAHARSDPALAALRDDARYRALVGLIDTDSLSRDAGWGYDLALLAREVKRKAWQPFRKLSEAEFDAAVHTLDESIPALSDVEVLVGMRRILALLGDGHAGVAINRRPSSARETLPVLFYLFEEGLFITAGAPGYEELLGSRVLRFGDHSIETIFAGVAPIETRDNEYWRKQVTPYTLRELPILHALGLIPDPHEVALTLQRPDGAEQTVVLAADSGLLNDQLWNARPCPPDWTFFPHTLGTPLPAYLRHQTVPFWFEHLPAERTVYCQFNMVRNDPAEELPAFSERLFRFIEDTGVTRLVIDLRWNNGGNTLLEMPLLHRIIGSRMNQRGRLFVIIGRRTFSAAQNFATMVERHTEALFVGEPTGSSPNFVGESIYVELPYSKLQLNVSDLFWQSSWPTDHRTWIAPLLYLPPTFAAYRENRDPALEAVLGWNEHLPGW